MRTRGVALIAAVALAVPVLGQSIHPQLKSKQKVIASFVVVPAKLSVSGKGAGEPSGKIEAERIASTLERLITQALKDSGHDVKEDALGKNVQDQLAVVQAAYDRIQPETKLKDVAKGKLSLGEGVQKLLPAGSVDALVFVRGHADLDREVQASHSPDRFGFTITPKNKVRSWISIVDARTGDVLYVFQVQGKDPNSAAALEKGITSALRTLFQ